MLLTLTLFTAQFFFSSLMAKPASADNQPVDTLPTVTIQEPDEGTVFTDPNGRVTLRLQLQDDKGVKRYHFDVDGTLPPSFMATAPSDTDMLVSSPTLPVDASFAVSDLTEDKPYTLTVTATDTAGATTTLTRRMYIDRNAPVITTGIQDGQQLTGTVGIDATTGEKNPTLYRIRIADRHGAVVAEASDTDNTSGAFTWNWNSAEAENGDYVIQYAVTDKAGRQTTVNRTVSVANETPPSPVNEPSAPLLTIAGINGRTVSGSVSDPNVTFVVAVDGSTRPDVAVAIGEQESGGVYGWTLSLPADVTTGVKHVLSVTANANGKNSDPATLPFILPYIPATPSNDATVDPLLQQLSTNLTQPFSVPDSFGDIPAPVKVPEVDMKTAEAAVLQKVKDPNPDQNVKAPVAATANGWKILGFYWYVWLLIGTGLTVVATGIRAWMRRRRIAVPKPEVEVLGNLAE